MAKREIERVSLDELITRYLVTQHRDVEGVREALYQSMSVCGGKARVEGWMLLQAQDMSSSWFGQHVILPYGPGCTWKELPRPGQVLSPRGLASDMSIVVAAADRELE